MSRYWKSVEFTFRKLSTCTRILQKNHYDSLGVSAKATQADIKSAYYKLSMIYHPDKNQNTEDAATKFRDITQAYEVLGNVKSRKLYDKGLYIENVTQSYEEPPINKFYQSRDVKSRPPADYNRSTVYDFDEWSRTHYGETFERNLRYKEKQRRDKIQEMELKEGEKQERTVMLVGLVFMFVVYLFYSKDLYKVDTVGDAIIVTHAEPRK